jgi:hypothetical protein
MAANKHASAAIPLEIVRQYGAKAIFARKINDRTKEFSREETLKMLLRAALVNQEVVHLE